MNGIVFHINYTFLIVSLTPTNWDMERRTHLTEDVWLSYHSESVHQQLIWVLKNGQLRPSFLVIDYGTIWTAAKLQLGWRHGSLCRENETRGRSGRSSRRSEGKEGGGEGPARRRARLAPTLAVAGVCSGVPAWELQLVGIGCGHRNRGLIPRTHRYYNFSPMLLLDFVLSWWVRDVAALLGSTKSMAQVRVPGSEPLSLLQFWLASRTKNFCVEDH